jgi:hypothetical protein
MDYTGHLMPEKSWGHKHFGVVTAAKDLEISPTGQGSVHANYNLSRTRRWKWHLFDANIFFAIENRGLHLARHE